MTHAIAPDRFLVYAYNQCQKNFAELDAFLVGLSAEDLSGLHDWQVRALRHLESRYDPGSARFDRDERELLIDFPDRHKDYLLPFVAMKAVDQLIHKNRAISRRGLQISLESGDEKQVVVPNAVPQSLFRPTSHVLGFSRNDSRTFNDRLDHNRVISVPSDIRLTYIDLARHPRRDLRLVDEQLSEVGCPTVACLNWIPAGTRLSDIFEISIEDTEADHLRGWKHVGFESIFRFHRLRPEAADDCTRGFKILLDSITAAGIHVVVFPELTVPPPLLDALREHLRTHDLPLIAAAGSFHKQLLIRHRHEYENVCPILARSGETLAEFSKTYRFHAPTDELEQYLDLSGVPHGNCGEGIRLGNQAVVIDTGAGRFGIAICIDTFKGERLMELYRALAVDFLLVPAMTARVHRLQAAAKNFAEVASGAFCLANSPSFFEPSKALSLASFVQIPIGARTTRIPAGSRTASAPELQTLSEAHAVFDPSQHGH